MKLNKSIDEIDCGLIKELVLSSVDNYIASIKDSEDDDGFTVEVEDGNYVQDDCIRINICKDGKLLKEFCISTNLNWCDSPSVLNQYR